MWSHRRTMSDRASREHRDAADWLALLDREDLSEAEDAALREWLDADPAHATQLAELAALWDHVGDTALDLPEDPEFAATADPVPHAETIEEDADHDNGGAANDNNASFIKVAAAVFGVLLLASVALFVWPQFDPDSQAPALADGRSYSTGIGEMREIELGDGSTANLNTDSVLDVRFENDRRLVILRRGEAHFSVAKDSDRPFRVATGAGSVEAVGTQFSVRIVGSDNIEVIVDEGRVKLDHSDRNGVGQPVGAPRPAQGGGQATILDAGQKYLGSNGESAISNLGQAQIANSLAWQQGELIFEDEPLENVIEEVQRYTSKRIVIQDTAIRSRKVGGYFLTSQADHIVSSLEGALGIRVEERGDTLYIYQAED